MSVSFVWGELQFTFGCERLDNMMYFYQEYDYERNARLRFSLFYRCEHSFEWKSIGETSLFNKKRKGFFTLN